MREIFSVGILPCMKIPVKSSCTWKPTYTWRQRTGDVKPRQTLGPLFSSGTSKCVQLLSPEETLPGGKVSAFEERVLQDALHAAQRLDHVRAVVVQVPQFAVVPLGVLGPDPLGVDELALPRLDVTIQVGNQLVFLVAHSRPEMGDSHVRLLGPPGKERGRERRGI
ncbi:hypothetical protein EYF80_051201 [Liparis tanakae]|uniref:Uncharacterized protein n=1 Tax=Liparis tanakae TaxID=230148 RepID=A0A4Z2FBU4_9TELE|nr:hypothetical protein EYF80_051201 [Liparis tanakae]